MCASDARCFVHVTPIWKRNVVMTVSVCLCVCVCVCLSASISPELHVRSSPIFVLVTRGRGSVLWRGCDTLCTSGFMYDVVLAHKPRQLNVAAQLIEAQPTCSLRLGYAMNGPLRANVLTLTGLLFGRRGLGVLGCSGRVEFS